MTTTDKAGRQRRTRAKARADPAASIRSPSREPAANPADAPADGNGATGRSRAAAATLDDTLESARRVLADVTAFLECEIDRLVAAIREGGATTATSPDAAERLKTLHDLIKQNQAALRTVLELRTRLGRPVEAERAALLDLEAARAEILDRVARLAPGD